MTTTRTARIHASFRNIDTLAQPATIEVLGSNLRAGMVLVDELGCPAAGLDHRVPAVRNSGAVRFLVHDLDNGGWHRRSFHANKAFTVVAK